MRPILYADKAEEFKAKEFVLQPTPRYLTIVGDKIQIRITLNDPSLEAFADVMKKLAAVPEARKLMEEAGMLVEML